MPKNGVKTARAASGTAIQLTLDSANLAPAKQSGRMFSGEGLAKLYDAILGPTYTNTGTYNKVVEALKPQTWTSVAPNSQTATVADALTSDDIRTNHGSNIQVMLGTTMFEVVYVTLNNSGELIVDLWQSTSTQTSPYAANAAGSGGSSVTRNCYDAEGHRPSNVYAFSYARAKMLGQGGVWDAFSGKMTSSSRQSAATVGASVSSTYGALWNDMITGNLSSFIDSPSQVKYQEIESNTMFIKPTGRLNYTLPGDAYGTPFDECYNDGGTGSYASQVNTGYSGNGTNPIAGQDAWKNDKIWLPAIPEVAYYSSNSISGIWKLDSSQRNSTTLLTRSGASSDGDGNTFMEANGVPTLANTSAVYTVRPALHLNLKRAQASATSGAGSDAADFTAVNTPTNLEFVYDGTEYTCLEDVLTRVEDGKKLSVPDAKGDTNSLGKIKWYDEVLHAVDGNTAGTAANTIYKTGSAIEYKIEYLQGSIDASGNSNSGKAAKTLTDFKIKGAGVYKITCSFEPNGVYKWRDISSGALSADATKTFTITVKQKEIKYKWKSSGGKLNEANADVAKQWKVTFDKDAFTPTSGTSQAPWVYLDYTLLTTTNSTDNASAALLTYDQANKKAMLGANVNDTLPCIVVKYVNTEQYDNLLDNIYVNKNGTTRPVNGTNRAYPQEAGNYTVTATDINAATSNYKLVPDAGEPALTSTRSYEIQKLEVTAPLKPDNPLEYSGAEQQYSVADFNDKYMEYGTWDGTTFTKDGMPLDKDGVTPLGMTADTTSGLVLKATAVNDYKVSFRLLESTPENTTAHPDAIVRNYKWKSTDATINGTDDVVTVNYVIQPKTLELDFHSSVTNNGNETFTIKTNDTTGKLTYTFKTGAEPVIPDGATAPEEPVLELYFAVAGSNGAGSINPKNATKPDEFLYADLVDGNGKHTAGKYVIFVRLADGTASPVNKNYRLKDADAIEAEMTAAGASTSDIEAAVTAAKATYQKEITLNAGETSLNDLPIVYKEGDDINNSDAPLALSFDYANKKNLQYKLGSDGKTPVAYWIYFDLSGDFAFLETVGAIGYKYTAPATDTSDCTYDPYNATGNPMKYAGTITITVKIQVKASERANNKLPAQADYDNLATASSPNKFVYTAGTPDGSGNVYDGTLVFTYEIRKAEVDATKISDTSVLQWKYSTETEWKDYTDKSYPEYNDVASVDFRVNPSKYNAAANGDLAGIKGADCESITNAAGSPDKKGPGTRLVTIAYTVDENNYEKVNANATNAMLVGKQVYSIEISPKVIDSGKLVLTTWTDADGKDITNSLGVPYQIWELDLDDPTFKDFIKYEYYEYDPATGVGNYIGEGDDALKALTSTSGGYASLGIDAGGSVYIYVKPVIDTNTVPKVNGEPKYALKDVNGTSDKDAGGDEGYKRFEFGKQMTVITVEQLKKESVYGSSFTAADILKITTGGTVSPESTYSVKVYRDKIADENLVGDLAAFCANSATSDAGKYVIVVTAVNSAEFVAVPSNVEFVINPKEIALPTLGEMLFNGEVLYIENFLGGSWAQYKDIIEISGDTGDRNVSKDGYTATLTLKDKNYKWAQPENAAVKLVLTAEAKIDVVSSDTATVGWNITPLVVDTSKMWNTGGSKGATLNLPDNIKALVNAGTLEVGYRYYEGDQYVESPQLKGGKSFKVEAALSGTDAEYGNVVFKGAGETLSAVSPTVNYTVPQSGAAAFFGNALGFVKSHWLWFVIALAILLFLIILICIIAHRRKTKEKREEKKAAKEEEKRRKEEEKEERKRKQEAELELQRAKQEAELAKMRAGLGLGAGAAGMAMAAQQAQPQQQAMPQQMPMQQQYQQLQYPQYQQPMQMQPQMQMPMPMPQQYHSMNASDVNALAEAKAQQAIAEARAAAAQSKAAEAIAEAKAAQAVAGISPWMHSQQNGFNQPNNQQPMMPLIISVGADGQITGVQQLNTMQNMQQPMLQPIFISSPTPQPKAELPQKVEESTGATVNTPTVYPPDAVITTTTTVDTTKAKPEPVSRDSERNFDIDGFYDTFDMNNK